MFYCQNQNPFIQDFWVTWNFYRWYPRYLFLNKEINVLQIYAFEKDKDNSKKTEKLLTKEIKLQKRNIRVWNFAVKQQMAFVVKERRTFYTFRCNTREEKDRWVKHLLDCLEKEEKLKEKHSIINPLMESNDDESFKEEEDDDENMKSHSLWTDCLKYFLSHSSIRVQRLPRMRWTILFLYFILGLALTIYIAWNTYNSVKKVKYTTPVPPESNSLSADDCYTIMDGQYYLDTNGYYNTNPE